MEEILTDKIFFLMERFYGFDNAAFLTEIITNDKYDTVDLLDAINEVEDEQGEENC
jgi:hypothetical protein